MTQRRTFLAAAAALGLSPRLALAQQRFASIFMFVPAGPGGGWDGLGRAIEQAARAAGLVGTFQFENVGGAGGTVGLPRFLSQRRGRADALMISGSVMVGATLTNKTPVDAAEHRADRAHDRRGRRHHRAGQQPDPDHRASSPMR